VTGERIRDKIAASKAKGMWMGGVVPLGYRVEARQLVIDPAEARNVRHIFEEFVACRSTTELVRHLKQADIASRKGTAITKQALWKLLNNRFYLGEISHKGKTYPGQHEAIIGQDLWDQVQVVFADNLNVRRSDTWVRRVDDALLRGLLYTADGERLQPSFTTKANGKRYRYYVPRRTIRYGADRHPIGMLPAAPIEAMVLAQVHSILKSPEVVQTVWNQMRAEHPELTEPEVVLPLCQLGQVWGQLFPAEQQRIVQLLVERVILQEAGIEIRWREMGWQTLAGEMRPGSIGAELMELEAQA
jgi:site-specific DNA recombinase